MLRSLRPRDADASSPRPSLRLGLLAGVTLAVFGLLIFRLWSLQVLSTSAYVALAVNNSEKTVVEHAPRGSILDSNGRVLVRNRSVQELQLDPGAVGDSAIRHRLLVRMARLLGEAPRPFWERVESELRRNPVAPVTIARNIDQNLANEIEENGDRYRGITVVQSASATTRTTCWQRISSVSRRGSAPRSSARPSTDSTAPTT